MPGEQIDRSISFTYAVIGIWDVYNSALKVPMEVVKVAIDMVMVVGG